MALRTYNHDTKQTQTEYAGAVLFERERNGYHDSDFYAVVWDEKAQVVRSFEYASTRYPGGGNVDVDGTPEAWAKAGAWARERLAEVGEKLAVEYDAKEAGNGDRVEVSAGRKFKQGRTGKVAGDKVLTYRHKPYRNGYVDRKTYKVWVVWDDGSGMDQVDVKNLRVLDVEAKAVRMGAERRARAMQLSDQDAVWRWYSGGAAAMGWVVM